jgi:hypothetical protein
MADRYKHLYKKVKVSSWKQLQRYSEGQGLGNPGPKEWNRWVFKGHKCEQWALSTTLERTLSVRFKQSLSNAWTWERRLSRDFMRKARGLLADPPTDTDHMEWLALMQHYGAPTRLHDWTYSFWAAVLFAIENASIDGRKSCAVWALEIDWWRDECTAKRVPQLKTMLKDGSNLSQEIKFILQSQRKNRTPSGIWPLNAYRLNQRVVAQQALFVVPLNVKKPFMENLRLCSKDQQKISRHLIKFVIPCSKQIIGRCVKYLYDHNLTSATLFPGIDGYARSLGNLVLLPDRFRGIGEDPNRVWPD